MLHCCTWLVSMVFFITFLFLKNWCSWSDLNLEARNLWSARFRINSEIRCLSLAKSDAPVVPIMIFFIMLTGNHHMEWQSWLVAVLFVITGFIYFCNIFAASSSIHDHEIFFFNIFFTYSPNKNTILQDCCYFSLNVSNISPFYFSVWTRPQVHCK